MFKKSPIALGLLVSVSALSHAATPTDIEHVTIFGGNQAVEATPGSGMVIDQAYLDDFAVSDIMRVLTRVPGVYITEEDGYGLRPNIGMRGNSADRSEKITIMEDGVLAAPAPYASPAAYYFPTIGRMSNIEILKGGSSVLYGPRTSGGVINLLTTGISDAPFSSRLDVALGSDGYRKAHVRASGTQGRLGALGEVYHYGADGFKSLPTGDETGFSKTDVVTKLGYELDAAGKHYLEAKLKYSEETSDETYLGVTADDFNTSPFTRYSASTLDVMSTEHKLVNLNYVYTINDNSTLSMTAYYNDFYRNWYKTDRVNGLSLGSGAEEAASAFDKEVAAGNTTASIDFRVKANNRNYLSQGVQGEYEVFMGAHQLKVGARVHNDEMDRFQWVDTYELDAQYALSTVSTGVPGTDSNRIDSANAVSAYIHDTWEYGNLTVSGGVRYEDVNLARDDWGKTDPLRTDTPARRRNSVSAILPGVGFTYQVNEQLLVLAGAQKSFAPPSPGNNNAEEEQGWNYETGLRYADHINQIELIGFFTQLDNLHGNCTASQGCDSDLIGTQYNAGKVDIQGVEWSYQGLYPVAGLTVPFRVNYTYSTAEFKQSFESELDSWGSVQAGDDLPYLPQHTMQVETGIQQENWQIILAVKHTSDMRTVAGSGSIASENEVPSRTLVDVSANYMLDNHQTIYAVIDNLTDEEYIATRQHGGIQVGKPLSLQVGYRYQF
ncbi:TonB-dependent receptor family protein [Alteromonas gilva]|uniref:TonB-dependent receptor n=1 Tax=Alteromonas gilva TaxID=2987522 RepID=A0ABT5L1B6_9ALTE|nr:TonB-dependent receptor [Alteromonas gilva]MDC8830819.1 TonB-dependent receptor [Alteromonas gilva]